MEPPTRGVVGLPPDDRQKKLNLDDIVTSFDPASFDAAEILKRAIATLHERGKYHDSGRERSMDRAVKIFGGITQDGEPTVSDGWLFMIALKLARMQGGEYNPDDYVDLICYAALLAESAAELNCKRWGE